MDHLGVIDVLRKFPSVKVDSSAFIYRLKQLQPKYDKLVSNQNDMKDLLIDV